MNTKLINLTKSLIKKKSVTPIDAGAIDVLKKKLSGLGLKILNFYLSLKSMKKF